MTDYRGWLRRRLLEDIYDKMSDDEKKLFIQMTMQNKDHSEIMQALQRQQQQLATIRKGQNWKVDFASDVAANLLTTGGFLLASKLFKNL